LLRDFHPPPDPPDSLSWSGIDVTGVQAIAGAGIGTKLVPELVKFKPVGNPPPKLVCARAKTLPSRRLRIHGLGGRCHRKFTGVFILIPREGGIVHRLVCPRIRERLT